MTKAKRIALNVLASYGRSVISFVVSLFAARWVLEALGEIDFGLFGVVGSIIFFVRIFNIAQAGTVARYYAYAIGNNERNNDGTDNRSVRAWFNSALSIHVVMPFVFILLGWPIGEYAIRHWLVIPFDRMGSCLWCFRFSLVASFVSMLSVPYVAMYTARQYITQLVVFDFLHIFGVLGISYWLLYVEKDRLACYAFAMAALFVCIETLRICWSWIQFEDCRISMRQMFDRGKIFELLQFSFFKFLGNFGYGIRSQGSSFVLNVAYGAGANAAFNVANQLSAQAVSFCSTLANAFSPAIATEAGAGRHQVMLKMAFTCCKIGGLLVLTFGIPLIIEMDNWLLIWLKNPPQFSNLICICMVLTFIIDYATSGHHLAIAAIGDIAHWQCYDTLAYTSTILFVILFCVIGLGPIAIGYAYIVAMLLVVVNRLYFARRIAGMGIVFWLRSVFFPLTVVSVGAGFCGLFVRRIIEESLFRIFITGGMVSLALWTLAWWVVLTFEERQYVGGKFKLVLNKVFCRSRT